jgi:hypothetical protein
MTYGHLFQPDPLIVEHGGGRRDGGLSSEKRLMIAVLRNALECYQQHLLSNDHLGRELFLEAAAWIQSTSRDGLFSFEGIAEQLDIDPGYLRRQLGKWRERRLAQASAAGIPSAAPVTPITDP